MHRYGSFVYKICRTPPKSTRIRRVQLLSSELDSLRNSAVERTRSLDAKASFVVVAAGVLASAVGLGLVRSETYYVGLIPFGLTVWTVVQSAAALWPRSIDLPGARKLVAKHVDSEDPPEKLEDFLLEVKTTEVENRNAQNEKKAGYTKRAFQLLVASLVAVFIVVGLNAFFTNNGASSVGPNPTPSPTATP